MFNGTKTFLFGNILVDSKEEAYPTILRKFIDDKSRFLDTLQITNPTFEAGGGQAGGSVRGSDPAGGVGNGGRYTWAVATFVNYTTTLAHIPSLVPSAFSFPGHGSALAFNQSPMPTQSMLL